MQQSEIERLLSKHDGLVVRTVERRLPKRFKAEADDVCQIARIALWQALEKVETIPANSFVYKVVRGAVIDEIRRLLQVRKVTTESHEHDFTAAPNTSSDRAVEAWADHIHQHPTEHFTDREWKAIERKTSGRPGADPDALYRARRKISVIADAKLVA